MAEPSVIKKLDETVVNRIAAGEVIQRPANAVKELLENSLDAKSTNISITLQNGGLRVLQIQDNGCGIRKEDLEIVCERFTTSKLSAYEDLSNISTFGFRGEALASISHIAHLTITTKTKSDPCAYKASYEDGKLKASPKACAANQGTTINVEDLFYNVATRRKAFKSPKEEHWKVVDIVKRYAIHNPDVGFSLKKSEAVTSDIKTPPKSTHVDNIRIIFGENISRELLEIEKEDEALKFKVKGFISNVNYSIKKSTFILFINNRLVDSSGLRQSIDSVYNLYLPKGSYPFIYLSLTLDPRNVDVNVHPTKHEVHFLHEELIIEKTQKVVEEKLLGSNKSRVFYTQSKLPELDLNLTSAVLESSLEKEKAVHAKETVRVDSTVQKLDSFIIRKSDTSEVVEDETSSNNYKRREMELTSLKNMGHKIEKNCNLALRDIVANVTFVGAIDSESILVQHSVNLYLFRLKPLLEEFFYQIMVNNFGNLGIIKFKESLPLESLVLLGLDDPVTNWTEDDGSKEEIAAKVIKQLTSWDEMLADYISVLIDDDKNLCHIPLLLDNYMPDISRLPNYLIRLACVVNWTEEQACFEGLCRETAKLYSFVDTISLAGKHWKYTIEHNLLPAIKKTLLPPKKFATNGTIVCLTSLTELYKVFERC